MRYRRADRCVRRAEAALDAGIEDEARAALEEARGLNPDAPTFDELLAAVRRRQRAAAEATRRSRARWGALIAAAALLAVLVAGWAGRRPEIVSPAMTEPAAASTVPAQPEPPATAAERVTTAPPDESIAVTGAAAEPGSAPAEPLPEATAGRTPAVSQPAQSTPQPRAAAPDEPPPPASAEERASPPPPAPIAPPAAAPTTADALSPPRVEASLPLAGVGASLPASSTPPPAPAPPPVREVPAAPAPASQEPAVRAVLARFEAAYSALSASAARQVWPSVDERALDRAFASLESQQVSLGDCSVQIQAPTAQAECVGTTIWAPKVGGGRRTERRSWQFQLAQSDGGWRIVSARAR